MGTFGHQRNEALGWECIVSLSLRTGQLYPRFLAMAMNKSDNLMRENLVVIYRFKGRFEMIMYCMSSRLCVHRLRTFGFYRATVQPCRGSNVAKSFHTSECYSGWLCAVADRSARAYLLAVKAYPGQGVPRAFMWAPTYNNNLGTY